MVEFLTGATTMGYTIAGVCFLRFWKRTRDRLFIHFAAAFWLFALNQLVVIVLGTADERAGYAYLLRVLGFASILVAIVGKNAFPKRD